MMGRKNVLVWGILLVLLAACMQPSPGISPTPPLLPPERPCPPVDSAPTASLAPEVLAWLKQEALPFETVQPGSGFADLRPLKAIIGPARIVALGEATHGSHEFFAVKHRLLEFLVEEMGFTTFAMEADWTGALRINEYVHTGQGDPRRLLSNFYGVWNTQEILDLIQWIRAYNQDPTHLRKVSFYGFDMQSAASRGEVTSYLRRVDSTTAERVDGDLQELYTAMQQRQADYEAASSPAEFAYALQALRVLQQYEEFSPAPYAVELRDQFMAENVAWLLEHADPGGKIVLWAHNGHVNTDSDYYLSMGVHLREKYQDDFVVFGFAFYCGLCNAVTQTSRGRGPFTVHHVPPALPQSYEAGFHSVGLPRFFLNLHGAAAGTPAAAWLQGPHYIQEIGAVYDDCYPEQYFVQKRLPRAYDLLVYFDTVSATTLLSPLSPTSPVVCQWQPENLDFSRFSGGWFVASERPYDYQYSIDDEVTHYGARSGHFQTITIPLTGTGLLVQHFRADVYRGQQVRLSGYVKTADVVGEASLLLETSGLQYQLLDKVQQPLPAAGRWKFYELLLNIPDDGISISFGVALQGQGQLWLSGWQFESVGAAVTPAP